MADNRNQRGSYRSSNQDWNDNRGRNGNGRNSDDDRNYGSSENRGYGNSSNREFDEGGSAGWQSRYEREEYNRGANYGGGYGSGRYGRSYEGDFNTGNFSGDRDYGYSSYYGSGSGPSYGSGSSNAGSRNLYDRDYEGSGRRGYTNSGTRIGAGNYGSYGDRERNYGDYNESRNRDFYESRRDERNFGGSPYGGSYGGSSQGRQDRNWWDRTTDEVSSWFGDDEAERRRDRDKQMKAQYRGKGPKNYNRSDERIKEDINDRLSDDPFVDASDVEVTVASAEVTLTGTVDTRQAKRRAEDIAEEVSGVRNVENRLRVNQEQRNFGQGTGQTNPSQSSGNREPERSSGTTSGVVGSSTEKNKNKSFAN